MNISLILSVLLCTLGIDAVVQGPRLVVAPLETGHSVTLKGPAAKAIFEHLQHPLVEVTGQRLAQKRRGYGIECSRRARLNGIHYSCVETLADGRTTANMKFEKAMKEEPQLLFLTLRGPELAAVYQDMSTEAHPQTLDNGSVEHKKISSNLSCTETVDAETKTHYACEQILSGAGYSWGTGTAPMIGAGTQPRQVTADNDL